MGYKPSPARWWFLLCTYVTSCAIDTFSKIRPKIPEKGHKPPPQKNTHKGSHRPPLNAKIQFRAPSSAIMLDAMSENPDITIEKPSEKAGITTSAAKKQLRQNRQRIHPTQRKPRHSWRIFASQSV